MKHITRISARWLAISAFFFSSMAATASDITHKTQVILDPVQEIILARGKPAKAFIRFHVNQGFHINSNQPGSDLLIPTTMEFVPDSRIKINNIDYPAGKELALAIAPDEKLNVYSGDVEIVAALSAASAAPGTYKLKGLLKYQACSDNACFPPKSLPLELIVKVE